MRRENIYKVNFGVKVKLPLQKTGQVPAMLF
jgi:hypothetical protein